MTFRDCLAKGLIRQKAGVEARVPHSLRTAERFLSAAEKNAGIVEWEMCLLGAYNSLFHSCRALLFKKGYVEKSHACLIEALRVLYKGDPCADQLNAVDRIRLSRHDVQYGGEDVSEEEARFVIDAAEQFLAAVKKTLQS